MGRQVLVNLIGNAIKFTSVGSVQIIVSMEKRTEWEYMVSMSVKDTGIGIAEEKQESIFASFQQADDGTMRQYEGTGLGLSSAFGIIRSHGGDMICDSIPGEGTSFSLYLPALHLDEEAGTCGCDCHGPAPAPAV